MVGYRHAVAGAMEFAARDAEMGISGSRGHEQSGQGNSVTGALGEGFPDSLLPKMRLGRA